MKKLFLVVITLVLAFILSSQTTYAQECELISRADDNSTFNFCVGGFDSPEELKQHGLYVTSSNLVDCRDWIQFGASADIQQDVNGYWTCYDVPVQPDCRDRQRLTAQIRKNTYLGPVWCEISNVFEGSHAATFSLCNSVLPGDEGTCKGCLSSGGVWTALGCISYEPQALVSSLLTIGTGVAGGIAFLLMIFGVFTMVTSAGNPENLQKGQQILTSAIAGLLFIIFSIVLLNLIGVEILKIPGF